MNGYCRFVLLVCAYCASQVAWLALGQHGNSKADAQGRTEHLPPCCAMVPTTAMRIVDAAMDAGLEPNRALLVAWRESRLDNSAVNKRCDKFGHKCHGIFQLHASLFPGAADMDEAENIAAGVGYLAKNARQWPGPGQAERAFRGGRP